MQQDPPIKGARGTSMNSHATLDSSVHSDHAIFQLRNTGMPLTGALLSIYLVSIVLFSEHPSTVMISTVLGFALAAVFALEVVAKHRSFVVPGPLVWFAVFLCYCTFQMIYAPGSFEMLFTLYQLLVLAVIIVNYGVLVKDAAAFDWAVYFAVICTFIYNVVASPPKIDGRIGSTLLNANGYAFLLVIGLLLAFRRILVGSSANRIISARAIVAFVIYFSLSVYGIVYLAGSRKGILLTIAASAILILYWLWQQPVRRRLWVSLLVIALFVTLGYVLYRSPQFARIVELSCRLIASRFYSLSGTSVSSV